MEKEKKEYPVIVFNVNGTYRVYLNKTTYLSFNNNKFAEEELYNILIENKDRIKVTTDFEAILLGDIV